MRDWFLSRAGPRPRRLPLPQDWPSIIGTRFCLAVTLGGQPHCVYGAIPWVIFLGQRFTIQPGRIVTRTTCIHLPLWVCSRIPHGNVILCCFAGHVRQTIKRWSFGVNHVSYRAKSGGDEDDFWLIRLLEEWYHLIGQHGSRDSVDLVYLAIFLSKGGIRWKRATSNASIVDRHNGQPYSDFVRGTKY